MTEKNRTKKKVTARDSGRFMNLMKASFIAISADIFLVLLKYGLAKITGSAVLLADALHSAGDFAVSFSVLLSIIVNYFFNENIWARNAERIVAFSISIFLIIGSADVIGGVFGSDSAGFILESDIPLLVAYIGVSIACAFILMMSIYKRGIGEKFDSIAFTAEGMHTHSDFFTSFGVLVTLFLAFFGIHLERVMTLFVGLLVMRIGIKLFFESITVTHPLSSVVRIIDKILPERYSQQSAHIQKFISGRYQRLAEIFARYSSRSEDWILNRRKKLISINGIIIVFLYISTGFYTVQPWQKGIEEFMGSVHEINGPGLHYHVPKPAGSVVLVDTEVAVRLESGFRTNSEFEGKEPEVYLWEFSHMEGRYIKVQDESIAISGDENLIDGNFLCYYKITDPVVYALDNENSHEILRSLLCHVIHGVLGHYRAEEVLISRRSMVEKEILETFRREVKGLPLGVRILSVYMQQIHPPVEVVKNYRSVASAREKKDEIIHNANGYGNDLVPRSRGRGIEMVLQAEGYAFEKNEVATGELMQFREKQYYFSQWPFVNRKRLWWETVVNALKNRKIYIVPSRSRKRHMPSDTAQYRARDENPGDIEE